MTQDISAPEISKQIVLYGTRTSTGHSYTGSDLLYFVQPGSFYFVQEILIKEGIMNSYKYLFISDIISTHNFLHQTKVFMVIISC